MCYEKGLEKKRDIVEHALVFWAPEKSCKDYQRLNIPDELFSYLIG